MSSMWWGENMKARFAINSLLTDVMTTHGWSRQETARHIGCGKDMLSHWQKVGAPKYIKIALLGALNGLHLVQVEN